MPQFNGLGEWCSGIAGAGVHWEGGTIWAAGVAGGAQWLNDDEVIGQRYDDGFPARVEAYNVRTTDTRLISGEGTVGLYGSRHGHWVSLVPAVGTRDWLGRFYPLGGPGEMGPDGSYMFRPNRNGSGWAILDPDGAQVMVTGGASADLVSYGNRRATWRDSNSQPGAYGLPAPTPITIPYYFLVYVFVGSEIWQLYQTVDGRVVFHPRGDPRGYVLYTGNAWRYDGFVLTPTTVRLVWSIVDGDHFVNIRTTVVDLTTARTVLSTASFPSPPGPVPPPTGCG